MEARLDLGRDGDLQIFAFTDLGPFRDSELPQKGEHLTPSVADPPTCNATIMMSLSILSSSARRELIQNRWHRQPPVAATAALSWHSSKLRVPSDIYLLATYSIRSSFSATRPTFVRQLFESVRLRTRSLFERPAWKRVANAVRYTRIPFLVFSVYSLGYQQGIIDCVKTPVALQSEILYSILLSMGLTRIDETTVEVIQETMLKPRALMMGKRGQIAHVGHRIVCAAREMVREELDAALIASASDMPQDATPEQIQLRAQQDPTVQFWTSARERLVGEEISNQPWQYIVIDSPSPNAFVTEVLPRRFFLTTSLLKVATTPDELAVVLGHEISHLILGHVSTSNKTESILRSLEILLLSLDPTSGAISLAVIGGLAAARGMISARHSRDHEYEADDMGLKLAARACFDTLKGSHVMRKMNELNVALEPQVESAAVKLGQEMLASHPPSLERFDRMQQRAVEENFQKYRNCSKTSAYSLWR